VARGKTGARSAADRRLDDVDASIRFREDQDNLEQARQREHIAALQHSERVARRRSSYAICAAALAIIAMLGVGYEWWNARVQEASAVSERVRADERTAEAERKTREADEQRVRALRSQVVQLAAEAERRISDSDSVTGMLLGLEAVHAVPGSPSRGLHRRSGTRARPRFAGAV
jgi:hypothetical protein